MTFPAKSLVVLIAAFAVCGCGSVFFAEVEEPEVCKTSSADFPAAPPGGTTSQSASTDFDVHGQLSDLDKLDYTGEFVLTSVQVDAKQGIADFSFVDSADLALSGVTDPSCNVSGLVTYQRDPSAPTAASSLTLRPANSVNLIDCLSAGTVKIATTFSGRLPTAPWSVDIKACFRASVKVNYLNRK